MTPNKTIEVIKFVLTAIAFGIAALLAMTLWTSDYLDDDDPYSITIEYDCRSVAKDPVGYPEQVIEECGKLLKPTKPKAADVIA